MAIPMPGRSDEQRYDPAAIPPRESPLESFASKNNNLKGEDLSPGRKSFRQGLEDKLNDPKYAQGKEKFKKQAHSTLMNVGSDPVKQFLAIIAVIRMGRQMRKNGEMSKNSAFLNFGRNCLLTGMNMSDRASKGVYDIGAAASAAYNYFTGGSRKNSRKTPVQQSEQNTFRPR